ncbi:MAG: FapA family protein [Helicobacteraceae bacterium]|nr:FapA family protein [Helicobacteraceae bacterium]
MSELGRPKLYAGTFEAKTSSIAKSIADLAQREKVHPASVDFDLLKVSTYVKEPIKDEFAPLTKAHLEKMRDKAYLLDPKLQFAQEYEVRFKPLAAQPFKFGIALNVDKFRSAAYVTLKTKSIVKAGTEAARLFLYFNKIKLRNNIMIYLQDDALRAAVGLLAQKANGEPFSEDISFALCSWIAPTETIDERLIWRYREKTKREEEGDRINYAERGFVSGVQKGETLIEHILPKQGTAGRSFDGKFIAMPEPKSEGAPDFTIDAATIEIKEEADKKLFIAKEDGYVKLENGVLSIDKTITLSEVSLKSTGNVCAGLDKGVKISIEGKDASEEVIGADMVVEASEIYANGSVASGALVTADKIAIKGQTHQKSELIGKHIEANVLRGKAQGEEVFVRSLEGGYVRSIRAEIEQAVGGEVKARTIKANNLRGKVVLQATNSIVVGQVSKGENRLIIDTSLEEEESKDIAEARAQIDDYRSQIEDLRKAKDANAAYLAKNLSAFKQVQEKTFEDRKAGRVTGEVFLKMFREYEAAQKKLDDQETQIGYLSMRIKNKKGELERFDKLVLEASVANESGIWKGHNEVIFKLPFLGREYTQNIDEGMRVKRIVLKESQDEGEYEIKLSLA